MVKSILFYLLICIAFYSCEKPPKKITDFVNPFHGTAPLQDSIDAGYNPPEDWRVWAGLTFPGSSVPNAMVQLSPITEWRSGAGYEYEDTLIRAFAHTNKGHWNLCHIPILPVSGEVNINDYASGFSHSTEFAKPGFYKVKLERYNIDVELSSSLRCGYHKYNFQSGDEKKIVLNLARSNERVRSWDLKRIDDFTFEGYQETGDKIYFYAKTNHDINKVEGIKDGRKEISVISFNDQDKPLEIKIALSFVSAENAKLNLESEIASKSFEQVTQEASDIWENLLSKVQVTGGSLKQKEIFYSCLYRSFLWPALRSDVNGDFVDSSGKLVNKGFKYYTKPSIWDTYRNKLVLLGMLSPEVTNDVIQSLIDRGEHTGFMPTFFHGDHAAAFIAGSYLRGLRNYDVNSAYQLLVNNATKVGGTRPYISEYIEKAYISTPERVNPNVETKAKAAVTKTLEYAYDDYSLALLANELGDTENYNLLMERSSNYKNLFDVSTGLMRGKLENGDWVGNFNPQYPYYEYMYREANAWQSSFFAPHDTEGLVGLYANKNIFEAKLDTLFSLPWNGNYIARNVSSFIGQYCHGNQPDHSFPWLYYFVDKQEKSQDILDSLLNHFYGMGKYGLAYCGMDDAGEMSSWYVFTAMGIYPYSPADDEYIVSVPIFDEVKIHLNNGNECLIKKENNGKKISLIKNGAHKLDGYFFSHEELKNGITITTE